MRNVGVIRSRRVFLGPAIMLLALARPHPAAASRSDLSLDIGKKTLTLAHNGKSEFRVVVPENAPELMEYAAKELQTFLHEISGARLPIVSDAKPVGKHEILLGDNAHLAKVGVWIDFRKLGKEGFTIRTTDDGHLIIAGATPRGTLYGVYAFLEERLGCRWYSSTVSRIPKTETIEIEPIRDTQIPVFEWREAYYYDPMDPVFAPRIKLNGNASKNRDHKLYCERHGGWGSWCHTSFMFVPPDKYFKDHPEYYALVGGKRQTSQLCFTNPDILPITVDRIKELIERPMEYSPKTRGLAPRTEWPIWADEEAIYWDISQNDTGGNCQCENCRAIDEREGTPMGSLLTFINQVAAEFPDKIITTLAYQYTRRPPKSLRPAKNVAIVLCNIECSRGMPLATSNQPADIGFRKDLENWSAICEHLIIYDYVVSFPHLVNPFPNLRVLQPNVQLFRDRNAKGVFEQGNREFGGEFCELRAYMLAKLLWDPDCDVDAAMDDFLSGYYGAAGLPIRRYIDLLHDALDRAGNVLYYGDPPQSHGKDFLSPEMVAQYDALFDEAERLVADDRDVLLRVQTARLPLMYAKLNLRSGDFQSRVATAERLFDVTERIDLRMFDEWGLTTPRFKERVWKALTDERRIKIEPPGGSFAGDVTVTLEPALPDAESRYTLDGAEPKADSPLYAKPLRLEPSVTLKARAFKEGAPTGPLSSALFLKVETPFESRVMRGGEPAQKVELRIDGARKLILVVTEGDDTYAHDHAAWGEAKVVDRKGKAVYLSELDPISVKQGWTLSGDLRELPRDKSIMGAPLRVADREFQRGLGAHAPSEIIYELGGKYTRFESWIGVEAEGGEAGSVRFKVLVEVE